MKPSRLARVAATAGVLLGLWGCGGGYSPNVGVGVSYLDRGPPRPRSELRGIRPGSGFVWLQGYWRWTGSQYDWVPGRWEPAAPGYRSWSPGRWRHTWQGWYWTDGRWR